MRLYEFVLPKNSWEMLISTSDKHELGGELIDLVKNAYSRTPHGSFVNSIADVVPSDWKIIDWDKDPDVDSTIFYRQNRAGETWIGYKIQGLGHDGQRESKDKAIAKLVSQLTKPGWWLESSDAMQHIMLKMGQRPITDERFLQRLFNDPNLRMINDKQYTRKISHGTITESAFGNPTLK